MSRHADRLWRTYLLAGSLGVAAACAVYGLWRSRRAVLVVEDGFTEWLAAALFLASCVVGAVRVVRCRLRPWPLLLIPVIGLGGFLDELSFGERHLHLAMPSVSGTKIDAVHDLAEVGWRAAVDVAPPAVWLTALGALTALVGATLWRARRRAPPLRYVALVPLFAVPALLVDLELFGSSLHLVFVEELLEVGAAWTWLCAALAIPAGRRAASGAAQANAATAAARATGPITVRGCRSADRSTSPG